MRVFSSVVVGVGVVVLDMIVLVAGVRVRVSNVVVAVFVGVRLVVTVFMRCHCRLLWCEFPAAFDCALRNAPWEQARPDGLRPILSGLQPSRRPGCRTVRMGLRCQGSGTRR
jgi:hypothetical protein